MLKIVTQVVVNPDLPLELEQEAKLQLLYPLFAYVVRLMIHTARGQGMQVAIFEGLRTFERQAMIYSLGRNLAGQIVKKELVVTNAPPGFSLHNYGLAVDLVFDGNLVKPGWQWSWDNKFPWKALADLGASFGLEAAYYWKKFPESPHFQSSYGFKERELLALYKVGSLSHVWEILSAHAA